MVRMREHLLFAPAEERGEHVARRLRHETPRWPRRIRLLGIPGGELLQRPKRILAARGSEAPRADGGADEVAHDRRRGQPFAEDCAIEPGDAQPLRPARRARHDLDIGRGEPMRLDTGKRTWPGTQGKNGTRHHGVTTLTRTRPNPMSQLFSPLALP